MIMLDSERLHARLRWEKRDAELRGYFMLCMGLCFGTLIGAIAARVSMYVVLAFALAWLVVAATHASVLSKHEDEKPALAPLIPTDPQ